MGIKCIVEDCDSRYLSQNKAISFHKLNISSRKYREWITAISVGNWQPNVSKHSKSAMICSKHFTEDSYVPGEFTRKLNENAVPSIFPRNINIISGSTTQYMENVQKSNAEVLPQTSGSVKINNFEGMFSESEIKIEPLDVGSETESTMVDPVNMIIAENLECSSADSFACENDQNIFATNFTYKNPVFLQMRIEKYEDDLKKVVEEHEALQVKLFDQKSSAKKMRTKQKTNKKLKEMAEFHEIYDKPEMNIPKLIFERFMIDYENTACPEDLKRFAAEVLYRSPDAYDYIRKCFTNVLPPVNDLQELLEEITSKNLSDDE